MAERGTGTGTEIGQAATPKLITFLSSVLQRVAEANDGNLVVEAQKMSVFHGLTRPSITIERYLERIFKYANCSPACYVVAYVYLDRFAHKRPSLPINSLNVHRLLITSVMLSAKFMDDLYYNNAYYAKVGGISTQEMNYLELDFLFGLSFDLNVTPNTYQTYCSYLQTEMMIQTLSSATQNHLVLSRAPKLHSCFNEEETSKQQQLAV